MESPTKATPAGCVIGLVGVALVSYAIVCGWVCYSAMQSTEIVEKGSLLRFYGISCGVSLIGGLGLLRLGWRMALVSDMTDPDNPDKPSVRF